MARYRDFTTWFAPIDANKVSVFPDWKKLEADFQPGTKELWLAVRATGKTKSAFPDGPAPEVKPAPGVETPKTPPPTPKPPSSNRSQTNNRFSPLT